MCIGIPLKVTRFLSPVSALCEDGPRKEEINILMLEDIKPGDWVLTANGFAREKLTEEKAKKIKDALSALESALEGKENEKADPFADITANTGKLPPHLQALVGIKPKEQD